MDGVVALIVIAIGLGVYFIPAIVASANNHPQAGAIGVLNLLLGWTLLGWVGALVWSLTVPVDAAAVKVPAKSARPPDAGSTKTCPHCISKIPAEATVCKVCRRDIASRGAASKPQPSESDDEPNVYEL